MPPVKTLCPIDHSIRSNAEEDEPSKGAEGGGEEGEEGGASAVGGARGRDDMGEWLPHAQSMRINGRRMLVCNINGMFFQVCTRFDYYSDTLWVSSYRLLGSCTVLSALFCQWICKIIWGGSDPDVAYYSCCSQ